MMILLPELGSDSVDQLLDLASTDIAAACRLARQSREFPLEVKFAASGGSRATWAQLSGLRDTADEIATDCGYPETCQKAEFDARMSVLLANHQLFKSGASFRDDVWSYFASSLLFHLSAWRYSIDARARFHGGIRNTFQRLWIRGRLFDRGEHVKSGDRWALLNILSEDAMVAISERPSLSGHKSLALAVAEGWARTACDIGSVNMQAVMRRAIIRLRLQNEVYALPALPSAELTEIVDQCFKMSIETDSDQK